MKVESRWVQAEGINTHYLVGGEGAPVILLHGASNDAREWGLILDPLSQHLCAYAPDLVGFGQSDKPDADYSFPFFIDFLHSFMTGLNLRRASLIGHSAGGGIALGFALQFPEMMDKLILVDSTGLGKLSVIGKLLLPIFALANIFRLGWTVAATSRRWMRQPLDLVERLPEVKVPTLLIWGAKDITLPVPQVYAAHKLMRNARLYIFPKCGHAPHKEKPEEFNQLILDFINSTL
jgi:4,5:9,10-diseco-3-hydroxy-5,9,17-trioxoandrosta-1(10),2-diene-4-oate hydrolase